CRQTKVHVISGDRRLARIFHEKSARRAETAALACVRAALRGWPRSLGEKQIAFPPVRNSAVLDQLAELIQTRRRLHEVETSCNLRAKQTKKWLPISLAPCRPSVTVREPGWLQLVPPNDGTDWIAQPGCLCPLPR